MNPARTSDLDSKTTPDILTAINGRLHEQGCRCFYRAALPGNTTTIKLFCTLVHSMQCFKEHTQVHIYMKDKTEFYRFLYWTKGVLSLCQYNHANKCHGVDGYHSCPEFDLLYSQCKTSQIICLMCWDLPALTNRRAAAFMTIWTTERCSSRPDWQWIQWQVCNCQTGFLLLYWLRNPGLFQEFPWPKWFSTTFQVLEFSREKSMTFQHLPGGAGTLVTRHSQ